MSKNLTQDTKTPLEIRIEFKEYFGIDLLEVEEMINKRKGETERQWHEVLVKNRLI